MTIKKKIVGMAPMTGVKSKFMKSNGKTLLRITIGIDIQNHSRIKKGSRIALIPNEKNPFKILIMKTNDKAKGTYSILQAEGSKAVHICPTWNYKNPKAAYFKKAHQTKVKMRKDGFLIELQH